MRSDDIITITNYTYLHSQTLKNKYDNDFKRVL